MKILQVEKLYTENGPKEVDQDYRDLVDTFRHLKLKAPIPNSDYLHGLYLIDLMFQSTKRQICMLNGSGESNWLLILQYSICNALARIKEKGGCLRAIFVGDGEPPDVIKKIQKKYGEQTVKFFSARTSRPVRHFIACDSRMLRIENIHDPITREMESDCITASVYLNNPSKAETKEEEFNEIWCSLESQE